MDRHLGAVYVHVVWVLLAFAQLCPILFLKQSLLPHRNRSSPEYFSQLPCVHSHSAIPWRSTSPASHPGLRPRAADVPAPGAQQRAPTGRIGLLRRLRSSSTELVRPLLIVGLPGLTCSWFELLVDPGEGACQAGTALSPEPARAAPRWSPRWPPSPSPP